MCPNAFRELTAVVELDPEDLDLGLGQVRMSLAQGPSRQINDGGAEADGQARAARRAGRSQQVELHPRAVGIGVGEPGRGELSRE